MTKDEKAKKYDILDCVTMSKKCPKCQKDIKVSLTQFKNVSFSVGLVWKCPYCGSDLYIKNIELEAR